MQQPGSTSPSESSQQKEESIQAFLAPPEFRNSNTEAPNDRRSSTVADCFSNTGLVNESIIDTSNNHGLLFSKCLSLGSDNFVSSSMNAESKLEYDGFRSDDDEEGKRKLDSSDEDEPKGVDWVARRRSTLGYLDYIFDRSTNPPESSTVESNNDGIRTPIFPQDALEANSEASVRIEPFQLSIGNQGISGPSMEFDASYFRLVMFSLDRAMQRSQQSQQRIHDWDRKMGLKRSHSKTMRLSACSRKKLREELRRDLELVNRSSNNSI